MTAFDCSVTGSDPAATPITMPLLDATWCKKGDASCSTTKGAKRPLYAYK